MIYLVFPHFGVFCLLVEGPHDARISLVDIWLVISCLMTSKANDLRK